MRLGIFSDGCRHGHTTLPAGIVAFVLSLEGEEWTIPMEQSRRVLEIRKRITPVGR